jgi:hypothetical protein
MQSKTCSIGVDEGKGRESAENEGMSSNSMYFDSKQAHFQACTTQFLSTLNEPLPACPIPTPTPTPAPVPTVFPNCHEGDIANVDESSSLCQRQRQRKPKTVAFFGVFCAATILTKVCIISCTLDD